MTEKVDIQSVIDKIQKLQSMANADNNATENEVNIATAQIKKLLAKHNLSMAQIVSKKTPSLKEEGSSAVTGYGKWDQYLHLVVTEICGTKCFYQHQGERVRVIFVGTETDVAISLKLYPILKKTVFSLNGKFMKQLRILNQYGSRNSHMLGVTVRMWQRAKEMVKMDTPQEQEQYGALVVVRSKEIQNYLDAKNMKKARSVKSRIHSLSYQHGMRDGNKVDLSITNKIN